jgi:hypothetical protein
MNRPADVEVDLIVLVDLDAFVEGIEGAVDATSRSPGRPSNSSFSRI